MRLEREILFELNAKPGNPRNSEGDFARLPDGGLMFAYSRFTGGSWDDHATSEICAVYAPDGETFDAANPRLLVSPERFGGGNAMSVTLRPNADGGVSLYFLVKFAGHGVPVRDEYYRIDSPDGYDFTGEAVLCFPRDHTGYHVVNNCRVETLSDGRVVIPAATHETRIKDGEAIVSDRAVSRFLLSDDGGYTFREDAETLRFPDPADANGLQEPGVIGLPDGRLYGYFRTGAGCQYESFSSDRGASWSAPAPSRFVSPLSPMKLARNPYSGRYYAIWNPCREAETLPDDDRTWSRTPLAIAGSENGLDFGEPTLLESDLTRGYCYPAIFFLSETQALVSYCISGPDTVPLQNTRVVRLTFKK